MEMKCTLKPLNYSNKTVRLAVQLGQAAASAKLSRLKKTKSTEPGNVVIGSSRSSCHVNMLFLVSRICARRGSHVTLHRRPFALILLRI